LHRHVGDADEPVRLRTPDELRQPFQHEREADGGHEQRDLRLIDERSQYAKRSIAIPSTTMTASVIPIASQKLTPRSSSDTNVSAARNTIEPCAIEHAGGLVDQHEPEPPPA
jgi:hypothetical protein